MNLFKQRAALVLTCWTMMLASATAAEMSKTVDGIEVFYGVVPAQVIARPTDKHDPKMHGGKWRSTGSHHLVVSLFDARSGERIGDASVSATVTPLGMTPSEKQLEAMQINGTTTYGNFFDFPASSAPFRISLKIMRPTIPVHSAVATEFEYRPPTGK